MLVDITTPVSSGASVNATVPAGQTLYYSFNNNAGDAIGILVTSTNVQPLNIQLQQNCQPVYEMTITG